MNNTKTSETNQPKKDLWSVTDFPFEMGKFVINLFEEKNGKYIHSQLEYKR